MWAVQPLISTVDSLTNCHRSVWVAPQCTNCVRTWLLHSCLWDVLSASDRMMFGLFPPSSRVTFFRLLLPEACWMRWPTWWTQTGKKRDGDTLASNTKVRKTTTAYIRWHCSGWLLDWETFVNSCSAESPRTAHCFVHTRDTKSTDCRMRIVWMLMSDFFSMFNLTDIFWNLLFPNFHKSVKC